MYVYPNHDFEGSMPSRSIPEWKRQLCERDRSMLTYHGFVPVEHDPDDREYVRKDEHTGLSMYITLPDPVASGSIRAEWKYVHKLEPHACNVDAKLAGAILAGFDNSRLLTQFTP